MMDLLLATSGGESQSASGGYVDDVFSAYTYTGNGATQTINNGIDLAGKGGLVWIKRRSGVGSHALFDSVRGRSSGLATDSASAQLSTSTGSDFKSFNSAGFSLDVGLNWNINNPSFDYTSWTFRRAPKFFDAVTYTGDGTSNRQIAHSLGVQAGFVTVKATSTTGDWNSYHRSATGDLKLNLTDAQTASRAIITAADANTFTVSGAANTSGVSYVAYLWAHDPSADGIIQCGSYTTTGQVNLGWEPQFILGRNTSTGANWKMMDTARGLRVTTTSDTPSLAPNSSASEESTTMSISINSTGFNVNTLQDGAGTYIYLAIRRPNKPPTTGTQVYNAIARTGTGAAATVTGVGFAPDLVQTQNRNAARPPVFVDRLRGSRQWLRLDSSSNEATASANCGVLSMDMSGMTLGADTSAPFAWNNSGYGETYINHFFRRAPGFMDIVCYTGTGVAHAIAHNLTKAPELIICKSRSAATQWEVWHSALAATEKLVLNSDAAKATDATAWNSTLPTATQFTVGAGANVNANAATFVTYLFATLAGISKVGSYTGNGSSQTINCGFATGARFFLVKATSTTGNWWVFDSARGIVSSFDPSLALNSTAAEVTSADAVDPDPYGIIVNQEATCSINATGVNYVFLAIA